MITRGIKYSDVSSACYLNAYIPEDKEEFYCFVYFHGGGLTGGGPEEYFIKPLCEKGIAVVSAQYRMYPEAKYPDYLKDAALAVKWTFDNIESYGKCKGVFVGGSSAGGYISQMLCFDNEFYNEVGVDPMSIAGYIHDAGQPTNHFNALAIEEGIDSRRVIINEKAPIYHIGTSENYPQMLFIVSDNDMQNRYEQTLLAVSTLKHFGHKNDKVLLHVAHGTHCSYVSAKLENGDNPFANLISEYILRPKS